jgi:hypothetical protein
MRPPAAVGVASILGLLLAGGVWASSQGSKTPHMDHEPKHGGVFFMAPDKEHHLEGVLLPAGIFKVYLYDDYTRPIRASGFSAELQVDGPGETRKHRLELDAADGTLAIRDLPVANFPVDLTVWITFPGRDGVPPRTELFNFSFEGYSSR